MREPTSTWTARSMRALLVTLALVVALSGLPLASLVPATGAQEASEETEWVPGSEVIVVLEEGDDPESAARQMGIEITHIYRHVFTGFSGTVLPPSEQPVTAARARQRARDISPDGEVSIAAQEIPTGVSRAGTPKSDNGEHLDLGVGPIVDADIAIVDTGIANDIDDLNVLGGINCAGGNASAWQDNNGHGTHVAGIAAAKDNDDGVVGVAPGAQLWAVKVLNAKGEGSFGDVICGLDWVAGEADQIDVINLSLSGADKTGSCSGPPLHAAVCAVVDAGVTVVVAAGNQRVNAKERVPASYDEVITVSGIADTDGQPGGLGPSLGRFCTRDDVFLGFSNFGSAVDIAAPGGCILSYNDAGRLAELSGTSQASPHVAGAAADFVAQGGSPTPAQVKTWLLTTASRPQAVDGVTGDPDSTAEKEKAKKKAIKKAKKKVKKAKGKKSRKRAKKKLKKAKRMETTAGHLEPVLWLEVLR